MSPPGPVRPRPAPLRSRRAPLTPRSARRDDLLNSGFWAASAGECGERRGEGWWWERGRRPPGLTPLLSVARRSREGRAGRQRRAARPLRLLRAGPVQRLPRRPVPAGLAAAAAGGAGGERREGTGTGTGTMRGAPGWAGTETGVGEDRDRCPRPPLSPQVPRDRCSLFDPAFSAQEVAALGQLGLQVLPENEVSAAARLDNPPRDPCE